jgi:hypothetical protein
MRYLLAIIGMIAVGIIVWRLLQWQERREKLREGKSVDEHEHDR